MRLEEGETVGVQDLPESYHHYTKCYEHMKMLRHTNNSKESYHHYTRSSVPVNRAPSFLSHHDHLRHYPIRCGNFLGDLLRSLSATDRSSPNEIAPNGMEPMLIRSDILQVVPACWSIDVVMADHTRTPPQKKNPADRRGYEETNFGFNPHPDINPDATVVTIILHPKLSQVLPKKCHKVAK